MVAVAAQVHRQLAAGWGMAHGVVQQVAAEFAQHPFVRLHQCRVGVNAEVQVALRDQGRYLQRHGAQHLVHPRGRWRVLLAQLLDLGQCQHLVGELGGAVYGVTDLLKCLQRLNVAPQRRLHLCLEHRQRRAQLV
ncbi:hypothetical protein D3C71_1366240 [compost metagenome]